MAQYCCKWNKHIPNLLIGMENLKATENYVDVTLICEGHAVKVHKLVLASSSKLFHDMFLSNPCTHPIIFLQDMKFSILQAIINFMYRGEMNIQHDDLELLLKASKALGIKGLSDICKEVLPDHLISDLEQNSHDSSLNDLSSDSPPSKKRVRTQSPDIIVPIDETNLNTEDKSDHIEGHVINSPITETCTFSVIAGSSLPFSGGEMQITANAGLTPTRKDAITNYEINPSPTKLTRFKKPLPRKNVVASCAADDDYEMSSMKKRSYIWNFFTPLNNFIAKCNKCSINKSYGSSISNLKRHLRLKHPSLDLFYKPFTENDDPTEEQQESAVEPVKETTETSKATGKQSDVMKGRKSWLWNFFTLLTNNMVECNICLKKQSYKSSTSNLKRHLRLKHPSVDLKSAQENSDLIEESQAGTIDKSESSAQDATLGRELLTPLGKKTSYIWNYFVTLNNHIAICSICSANISHRSSTSNLKRHLLTRHSTVNVQNSAQEEDLAERNQSQEQIMVVETEAAVNAVQEVMNDETFENNSDLIGESQAETIDESESSAQGPTLGLSSKFQTTDENYS